MGMPEKEISNLALIIYISILCVVLALVFMCAISGATLPTLPPG